MNRWRCERCTAGAHSDCDATARDAEGALTLCGCDVCLDQFEQDRKAAEGSA